MRRVSFARLRSRRLDNKQLAGKARGRLLLAALVLVPLIYLNVDLIRKGFKPPEAGFNIELAQTTGIVVLDEDEE